jgi:hypothetical protein
VGVGLQFEPSPRGGWALPQFIYHIKGTPAALLGHVEAPDEETATKKAIEDFATLAWIIVGGQRPTAFERVVMEERHAGTNEG